MHAKYPIYAGKAPNHTLICAMIPIGDLKREIVHRFPDLEDKIDTLFDDENRAIALYTSLKDRTSTYGYAETAVDFSIDIDRLAQGAVKEDFNG